MNSISIKSSVLMSVYKNDNPGHFETALNSIICQTKVPDEVIIVVDGPISLSIKEVIERKSKQYEIIKVYWLENNMGHGYSRQYGLQLTNHDYVALMDSDDISLPDRFEKQIKYFKNNEDLDVLGGQIQEFIGSTSNIVGVRQVPLENAEINKYLKSRCPFNQTSVMMRKSSVLAAGGYINWYCEEDYYLWVRMRKAGCNFNNLPDNLVYVRVGKEMYGRRGGIKYFLSEAKLQKYMLHNSVIGLPRYVFNIAVRVVVQVLLPIKVRAYIFRKLFRRSN